jgi:hypothetical protein
MPWGEETSRVAGRYGFAPTEFGLDFPGSQPEHEQPERIDKFLGQLYEAMLDDLAEDLAAADTDTPVTPSVAEVLGHRRLRHVQSWRASVDEEDDDDDELAEDRQLVSLLRELRDLLNERLPA